MDNLNVYDVIIIGAGPAGVTASLYTKRSNLNTLVIYYGDSSLEKARKIENYYGFSDVCTDEDFIWSRRVKQPA